MVRHNFKELIFSSWDIQKGKSPKWTFFSCHTLYLISLPWFDQKTKQIVLWTIPPLETQIYIVSSSWVLINIIPSNLFETQVSFKIHLSNRFEKEKNTQKRFSNSHNSIWNQNVKCDNHYCNWFYYSQTETNIFSTVLWRRDHNFFNFLSRVSEPKTFIVTYLFASALSPLLSVELIYVNAVL